MNTRTSRVITHTAAIGIGLAGGMAMMESRGPAPVPPALVQLAERRMDEQWQQLEYANVRLKAERDQAQSRAARAEWILDSQQTRRPLNADGLDRVHLWPVAEQLRDRFWHVLSGYLTELPAESYDLAFERLALEIGNESQMVAHDLIGMGWHYGYAAAHDDPLVWQEIQPIYNAWIDRYDPYCWDRPSTR